MFWYAESALPVVRPIIAGLYVLDGTPVRGSVQAAVDYTVELVPRFRQRVEEAPLHLGMPEWVDDPHFDRDYHFRRLSVAAPGGMRELLELAGALLATPLDRERPLWEAYYAEGLEGGRSAFFLKLHHAVVDGVGSIALLRGLTQASAVDRPPHVSRARSNEPSRRGWAERMLRLAVDDAQVSARLALNVAASPLRVAMHPRRSLCDAGRTARSLRGMVADLARPAVVDPLGDAMSGLSRRLDVLDLSLERLKEIKTPLQVTLNDLILAALAGALGGYHRKRRLRVDELNCLVPVDLRSNAERDQMGNRVGNICVALPVGETRPEIRLRKIVEQTREAKIDRRAAGYAVLAELVRVLPASGLGWIMRQSFGKVNVACTNVPGVSEPRFMGGARVSAIYPFASVVERTPLVIALLSYAGSIHVGIDVDPEAIPDAHVIAELLESGIEEMKELAARRRRIKRGRKAAGARASATSRARTRLR